MAKRTAAPCPPRRSFDDVIIHAKQFDVEKMIAIFDAEAKSLCAGVTDEGGKSISLKSRKHKEKRQDAKTPRRKEEEDFSGLIQAA